MVAVVAVMILSGGDFGADVVVIINNYWMRFL